MALRADRVGVREDQVDIHGRVTSPSFFNELLEDLPEWTDMPVWVNGTEELLPSNNSVPVTSPILADIAYPDIRRDNQYFTYRESPTSVDGLAKIKSIKGNTLVWNQLCRTLTSGNWAIIASGSGTLTFADGVATFSTTNNYGRFLYTPNNLVSGHKYLLSVEIKAYANATIVYALGSQTSYASQGCVCSTGTVQDANWHRYANIGTFTSGTDDKVFVQNNSGSSNLQEIQVRNIMYFDLTQMGLDISSPSEFTSLFSLPYYDFNQGSLLSFNGNGIKTTPNIANVEYEQGAINSSPAGCPYEENKTTNATRIRVKNLIYNEYGKTYNLYFNSSLFDAVIQPYDSNGLSASMGAPYGSWKTTSPIVFTATGSVAVAFRYKTSATITADAISQIKPIMYKQDDESVLNLPISTYFPTGMKSAGIVYDELTPTKAVTRIGAVDLGSLTWTAVSTSGSNKRLVGEGIENLIKGVSASEVANIKCALYETITGNKVYQENKGISVNSTGVLSVYDPNYQVGTNFKQAMSGVYLYYELATPVELPTMSFE